MNSMILNGKWRQVKGAVQEKWSELTDDDMHMLLGEKEQLIGRIQERYGYSQERAQQEVTAFVRSLSEEASAATEIRDKSAEVVRKHPWYTAMIFAATSLLAGAYVLNHFFSQVGEMEATEGMTT